MSSTFYHISLQIILQAFSKVICWTCR